MPEKSGGRASIGVGYQNTDGKHFKIYVPVRDSNGELTYENDALITTLYDGADLEKIEAIETNANATFISYQAAASKTAPEEIDIATLNALFTEDARNLEVDENGDPVSHELTFATSNAPSDEDFYYVYIRLVPNVSLYSGFIDYLWHSMPFGLCYDVRLTFSVAP